MYLFWHERGVPENLGFINDEKPMLFAGPQWGRKVNGGGPELRHSPDLLRPFQGAYLYADGPRVALRFPWAGMQYAVGVPGTQNLLNLAPFLPDPYFPSPGTRCECFAAFPPPY